VGTAEQRGAGVRDAKITIVGGGAVGCAVAYVLSRAGYADIQVIEQGELAGATSGQAAGLVGQVRATRERCRLAMASVATYSRIEQETGFTADWRQTGSVRIAMTGERAVEFRELAGVARSAGLEVEFLTPARLAELCPVLEGARAGITRTTTACPAQPIRSAGSHKCGPALRAGGDDQQRPGTAGLPLPWPAVQPAPVREHLHRRLRPGRALAGQAGRGRDRLRFGLCRKTRSGT
jgi:glycine/D-amino acid oxidase-like deaminating enzyme